MQTQYNVKETALRFASFEPDTEKQSRGFQVNEASDVIDHVLLAKRIKLRYSASLGRVRKRRCTEWSVYDIKVPREPFESIGSVCSLIILAVL